MLCRSPAWVRAHAYYMHLVLAVDTGVYEDTPGPSALMPAKSVIMGYGTRIVTPHRSERTERREWRTLHTLE